MCNQLIHRTFTFSQLRILNSFWFWDFVYFNMKAAQSYVCRLSLAGVCTGEDTADQQHDEGAGKAKQRKGEDWLKEKHSRVSISY